MPNNLTWRRCTNCGQLTLVPVNADVCWQCGAPCPEPRSSADSGTAAPVGGLGFPSIVDFGRAANQRLGAPAPPSTTQWNLPHPRPRWMDLTPADDAIARRLLASVFPDGFEL